jgi:hypothetical protein
MNTRTNTTFEKMLEWSGYYDQDRNAPHALNRWTVTVMSRLYAACYIKN